jgi:ZIP family zinc transporter
VTTSIVFGVVASSALVLGALIGVRFQLPKRVLAILLSFAAGALITALTFELFEDAFERGGIWRAALGLFAGAVVFTALSALLDRWAQPGGRGVPADEHPGSAKLDTDAAARDRAPTVSSTRGAAGLALLAAVTLDGVPENVALGVSLGEGTGGLALLVIAVVVGAGPLSGSDPETISLPLAFAAGAVIASLADTLMPEAYEHGGPAVALSTAAGFVLSFVLSLA